MKTKGILTFVFCLCVSFVFGQLTVPGGTVGTSANGNVGIGPGVTTPAHELELNGNFQMQNNKFFVARRADASPHTVFGLDTNNDFVFNFSGVVNGSSSSVILGFAGAGEVFDIRYNDGSGQQTFMRVLESGNVGIGTMNPQSELSVKGKIESQEVQVKTSVADYVFEENYNMLSLEELESYIEENGHLPNIQTQKDVDANRGLVSLGELSVSLMEKVEVLTLHMIEMNKRVKQLEAENKKLKADKE